MKQRLILSLVSLIILNLFASPLLALAAGPKNALTANSTEAATSGNASARERDLHPAAARPSLRFAHLPARISPARTFALPAPATLPGQSATLLPDGRWLLVGGEGPDGPLAAALLKDPRSEQTTVVTGELRYARAWHTATLLPDGTVFIFGGVGATGQLVVSAELFQPDTQQFEPLSLTGLTARAYHTATLLTEGQVLLAGGLGNSAEPVEKAELWELRNGHTEVLAHKLKPGRYGHTATLLPEGNVLVWGGSDQRGEALAAGEIYDATKRRFSRLDSYTNPADEAVPQVAAAIPVDGAAGVSINARVALRFSKPLQMATLNAEHLTLTGPQGVVSTKVVPAEGGMLAFLTPNQALLPATTYTLSLGGAVDRQNRALPATVLTFTTAGAQTSGEPDFDDEAWEPSDNNYGGDWRSGRSESPFQKAPPLQAPPGVTALAGQVLTLQGKPLPDVTLQIEDKTTRTDNLGRFLLYPIAAKHQVLKIDGRTASKPGKAYGLYRVGVKVAAGKTNVLPFTIWQPKLDLKHAVTLPSPTTAEMVITNPKIPGLELRLPAQTVIRDTDGQTVAQLSITPIPTDRPPFPLPPGIHVPTFFTIQPGSSTIIPPRAQLIYPNFSQEPPGTRIEFWNYDPEGKGWYVYGKGTVSANGKQVIPDPGVVLYEFTGAMIALEEEQPDAPSNSASAADPVDLASGLFILDDTDLLLPDVIPIAVTRTYRPRDTKSRPFGIGATHTYEMRLTRPSSGYQEADIVLPDGQRIHYVRISPGTGWTDAEYEHTSTPTAFYKSRLKWNGSGWDVTLRDGTVYVYGDSTPLKEIRDRHGNKIIINRAGPYTIYGEPYGHITKITSPNGRWVEFTYNSNNRVTQAKDNIGRAVNYTYDASGRLWQVTNVKGEVTEYTYDTSHRMLTIKDPRGTVYVTI